MTFTNKKLEYKVTLDTELNLFIVFSTTDHNKVATGTTIEQAVKELEKIAQERLSLMDNDYSY